MQRELSIRLVEELNKIHPKILVLVWVTYPGGYNDNDPCMSLKANANGWENVRYSNSKATPPHGYTNSVRVDMRIGSKVLPVLSMPIRSENAQYLGFILYDTQDQDKQKNVMIGSSLIYLGENKTNEYGTIINVPFEYFSAKFMRRTNDKTHNEGSYQYTLTRNSPYTFGPKIDLDAYRYGVMDKIVGIYKSASECIESDTRMFGFSSLIDAEMIVALLNGHIPKEFFYAGMDKMMHLKNAWLEEKARESIKIYSDLKQMDTLPDRLFIGIVIQGFVNIVNSYQYIVDCHIDKTGTTFTEEYGAARLFYSNSYDCEDGSWFLMLCMLRIKHYFGKDPILLRAKKILMGYTIGTNYVMTCNRHFVVGNQEMPPTLDMRQKAKECHALGFMLPRYHFLCGLMNMTNMEKYKGKIQAELDRLKKDDADKLTPIILESTSNTFCVDLPIEVEQAGFGDIWPATIEALSNSVGVLPRRQNLKLSTSIRAIESYFDFIAYDTTEMIEDPDDPLYKDMPKFTEFIYYLNKEHCPELAHYLGDAKMPQYAAFQDPKYILNKSVEMKTKQAPHDEIKKVVGKDVEQLLFLEPPPVIVVPDDIQLEKQITAPHPHAKLMTTLHMDKADFKENMAKLDAMLKSEWYQMKLDDFEVITVPSPLRANFIIVYIIPNKIRMSYLVSDTRSVEVKAVPKT